MILFKICGYGKECNSRYSTNIDILKKRVEKRIADDSWIQNEIIKRNSTFEWKQVKNKLRYYEYYDSFRKREKFCWATIIKIE